MVKVINRFLSHKQTFAPLPEDDPLQDTSHLTEEEKKNREEQKAKAEAEENKKKEEEKKAEEDAFAKLNDLQKIQFTSDKRLQEIHKEIEEKLEEKRLSKEEKEKLLLSIRYSYLKHEELVEAGFNPLFDSAKNLIMQGLSFRLDPYEKSNV